MQREPQWRDLFTTGQEFDVYRYQSFIFTFVVAVALLISGTADLSTFSVPTTILGILGISQVVYIGGKILTPTDNSDVNSAISELREEERKLWSAAEAKKGAPVASLDEVKGLLGQPVYEAYLTRAREVANRLCQVMILPLTTNASSRRQREGGHLYCKRRMGGFPGEDAFFNIFHNGR